MIEKCPICNKGDSLVKKFAFPTYDIYSCNACLVRFSVPFVRNREVYDSGFIVTKKQYLDTVTMNDVSRSILSPYYDVKGQRILDIGCGTGSFLEPLKKDNEVLGVEISDDYRPILEDRKIPHLIGDIGSGLANIPDDHFDLITLWDVFEHLEDCNGFLDIVKQKLAPSGTIIIWTNNYNDCISKFAEAVYRISFGRANGLFQTSFNRAGGHNYNFVPKTLEGIYRRNGLKIVRSVITDTPSEKLTKSVPFKMALDMFYLMNRMLGKGKIICHVLKKC